VLLFDVAVQYLAKSIDLVFDIPLTFRDPLLNGAQRHMIEVAHTCSANLLGRDQTTGLEDLNVLNDAGERHRKRSS
jgi:hypothetical protein